MEYAIVVLLVFALYLLARWQYVKRPLFYLLGVGGIALAFFGGFFFRRQRHRGQYIPHAGRVDLAGGLRRRVLRRAVADQHSRR